MMPGAPAANGQFNPMMMMMMGQAMQQMMNQGNPMMNSAAPMVPTVPQQMVPHDDGQSEHGSESEQEQDEVGSASGSAGSRAASDAPPQPVGAPAQPQPALPPLPAVHEHDEEQWRAQRFADSFISRSVTYVKNMPRQHLAICMEYVDPKLELAFTSECSLQGLLALLWLYSRVKPCVKVLSDLRSLPAVVYGNHCLFLLLVCASQCQYTVLVAHRLCDQNFPLPLSDSCLLRLHQIRGLLQVNETCPHQNFVWHWDGAVQGPNCGQVPTGP